MKVSLDYKYIDKLLDLFESARSVKMSDPKMVKSIMDLEKINGI